MDRPGLVTLPIYSSADECITLPPRAYAPFPILRVTKLTVTVEENIISNYTSIERAPMVKRSINHSCGSKSSKISSEDKTTLRATDFLRKPELLPRF